MYTDLVYLLLNKTHIYNVFIKKVNMSDKMLKFVNIGQQTPPKREVGNRKEDFNEIYKEFINEKHDIYSIN